MSTAYVDSSYLVALALNEPTAPSVRARMAAHDHVVASNLAEAELRAACARDGISLPANWLDYIEWVYPTRALTPEVKGVLAAGYLRGADLWHVAVALYVSPEPARLTFLTLDLKQRAVAAALGFAT